MSAFLGPIHYWVFNKVKFQNSSVDNLIDFAKQKNFDLAAPLAQKYNGLETAPLEDIIDTSNIHAWLQERVSLVEYRLATAVKIILDNGIATVADLQKLFYEIGSMQEVNLPTARAAYKMLEDFLLDGMPCDRINLIISQTDSQVVWHKNGCLHSHYWKEAGIDVSIYYLLRESLIAGLLHGSDYVFEKQGENCVIKAKDGK